MSQLYEKPLELLQTLVRYDTTNPPGNETEITRYLQMLLEDAGLETTILAKADHRPNLIARLPGQGTVPPLDAEIHSWLSRTFARPAATQFRQPNHRQWGRQNQRHLQRNHTGFRRPFTTRIAPI